MRSLIYVFSIRIVTENNVELSTQRTSEWHNKSLIAVMKACSQNDTAYKHVENIIFCV